MQIKVRAHYTVDGGAEQSKDLTLTVKDSLLDSEAGHFTIMSMAADNLIEEGQIMLSSVEVLTPAEA